MFVKLLFLLMFLQIVSSCDLPGVCTDNSTVQEEIVNIHNDLRRNVSPSAQDMLQMSWKDEIKESAQAWVDNCILAHGPTSTRLINGYEMGENLFYSSIFYSWTDVINAWHSEVAHYSYPTGSINGNETGHYTQVIWNTSYKVGCAVTQCTNGIYFYGCQYYRAGNFQNTPPYTEGSWCEKCPNNCENRLCTNPCPYINNYSNCAYLKSWCSYSFIKDNCAAECNCSTEIIPVYRK